LFGFFPFVTAFKGVVEGSFASAFGGGVGIHDWAYVFEGSVGFVGGHSIPFSPVSAAGGLNDEIQPSR
jgi:hypothetical protein